MLAAGDLDDDCKSRFLATATTSSDGVPGWVLGLDGLGLGGARTRVQCGRRFAV